MIEKKGTQKTSKTTGKKVAKKTTPKKRVAKSETGVVRATKFPKKSVAKAKTTDEASVEIKDVEKKPALSKRGTRISQKKNRTPEQYAVIVTGGKQYTVSVGDRLQVEKLTSGVGDAFSFDRVLMIGGAKGTPKIGTPTLNGAVVKAKIVDQGRCDKIIVFKKKRRKGYSKKQGHRQPFTMVEVTGITE